MPKRSQFLYINDIITSIEKIFAYTNEYKLYEFRNDEKTKDAVIRNFEIIGEAVKKLNEEFREKYDFIDWKSIAGMRDKLIHFYFGVDIEIVWKTIK